MTTMLHKKFGFPLIAFEGEGAGSGGGDAAAAAAASDDAAAKAKGGDAASTLYPDDKAKPAGVGADGKPAETAKAEAAGEWKEYVNDPAKTADENAALKAEHDKTKPAEQSDEEKALDTVPEDGKYNITLPEGIEVDKGLLDRFSPKFKEAKLTQRQVQAVTSEYAAMRKEEGEKQLEAWGKTVDGWKEAARTDADMGGDKWDATTKSAIRAVTTLGTPELQSYLEASGGGNHPELIRFMAKVGAMIKEDSPATGQSSGGQKQDRISVLYPDDKPKGK